MKRRPKSLLRSHGVVASAMGLAASAFAVVALALAPPAEACTTFLLERAGGRVVGKSYDWYMGHGLLLVNKRGVAKQALLTQDGQAPARWVSRHASVTFNQYGRELPNGGMNDAGLIVEIMWLNSSEAEKPDRRPAVNELQWIQYQLDSFADVAEMTSAAPRLRVAPAYAKVHYLACDRTGACAAFEHIAGKLVVTPGARALTNHTYAESAAFAARSRAQEPPRGLGSLERFARASRRASQPDAGGDPVAAAFEILDGVRGSESQWQIVYDPAALRVSFRTKSSRHIKRLDFGKLERSCSGTALLLDIDADLDGDVTTRLRPYDQGANRRLVERSLRDLRKMLPPGVIDLVASYPSALACAAP